MRLPEDFLTALGRVVAASAVLEAHLARFVVLLARDDEPRDWFVAIDSAPLTVLRRRKDRASTAAGRRAIDQLCRDAGAALDGRDRAVHSVVVRNLDDNVWIAAHARTGEVGPLPQANELVDLAMRLEAIGARSVGVYLSVLADSVRTEEAT